MIYNIAQDGVELRVSASASQVGPTHHLARYSVLLRCLSPVSTQLSLMVEKLSPLCFLPWLISEAGVLGPVRSHTHVLIQVTRPACSVLPTT